MATYYVRKNGSDGAGISGNTSNPWRTINYANGRVGNGDTVKVGPGVYNQEVTLTQNGVTWQAENSSNRPILDGNYGPSEVGKDYTAKTAYIPGSMYGALWTIKADNVVVDGFVIRNVAGEGMDITNSSNVTVRNCLLNHIFNQGMNVSGSTGCTVEDTEILVTSLKVFVPKRDQTDNDGGTDKYAGGGAFICTFSDNTTASRCTVAYGYGESMDFGKGSDGSTIEDCVVHDSNHVLLYTISSTHTTWSGNVAYISPDNAHLAPDGDVPGGMVYGDEKGTCEKAQSVPSHSMRAWNNLVVNSSALFQIRWNSNNYFCTEFDRSAVAYNTFVAGPNTRKAILIDGKPNQSKWHRDTHREQRLRPDSHTSQFDEVQILRYTRRNLLPQ